jgi:hypothetical protein
LTAVAHRCDAPPPPLSIVTAPTGFDAAVEVFVPIADGQVCITTNIDFQPALWIDGWVTR